MIGHEDFLGNITAFSPKSISLPNGKRVWTFNAGTVSLGCILYLKVFFIFLN